MHLQAPMSVRQTRSSRFRAPLIASPWICGIFKVERFQTFP